MSQNAFSIIVTTGVSLIVSSLVERMCKGNRVRVQLNRVANLTPLRFRRHFTDNNSGLIARRVCKRDVEVTVCFDFHTNDAAS